MRRVSVIMGIYNCEKTLAESVQSILDQTFEDWDLILCDDGSTDLTYNIAAEFEKNHPGKIRLLRNETNMGLNITLNHCLSVAEGEYIARQDGDDVSLPTRLEKEVEILDSHQEYVVTSTPNTRFDENGDWGLSKLITEPGKEDLMRGPVFAHASCMVRKNALTAVDGYSVSPWLMRVEDYHLWYKLFLHGFRGFNLSESLYRCRDDRNAQCRRKFRYRMNESYVKWLIFRNLKLPVRFFFHIFRPVLVGLLPSRVYSVLHKAKFSR